LDTDSVGSELSGSGGPSEGSKLGEIVTSVTDASVGGITWDLSRDDRSLWGSGEGNSGTNLWAFQVLVIGDVVDDNLLSNISVEGLLVLGRRQVSAWGSLSDSVGDQSRSSIDTGSVTSGTVSIRDASGVRASDAKSVAESGSDLDIEEVVDGDPVSEVVSDDLLSIPIVLSKDRVKSDFSSGGVDGHAWWLSRTRSLLSSIGLGESQGSVFRIRSSNVVDVWNNIVINSEDGSESSCW
jgi:hypothetical protein